MFQRTKICSGLLLAFGSLYTALPAFAQDDQSVQRVEITGSSIKRIDAETTVPVTVIKADDLKKQGITTVEQIMSNISAVQTQQSSSQAVGLGTGGAAFADIRGLGPNKTLVLLNGRRIANQAFDSSAPDLNLIPFAAIERVEVLRDGASALYGTDAISGVINFITRRDYRGGTITLGVDHPSKKGGGQHSANVGFGAGDIQKDGINFLAFVDFQKQDQVLTSQRPYYQNQYDKNGTYAPSGTTFPGTYIGAASDGNAYAITPNASGCPASQHLYQRGATDDPTTAQQCGEVTSDFIDFVPASERVSGFLRGDFKLNENNTFSLETFMAHSTVTPRIAPVPYGALYMLPSSPYFPGNGINPTQLPAGVTLSPDQNGVPGAPFDNALFIKYRDTFNGYREDDNSASQLRVAAILEGNMWDWDYNVAATLNTNHVQDFLNHGYSDINVLATQVTDPNSPIFGGFIMNPAINPFGPQSAAGAAILSSAVKKGVVQYGNGRVQTIDGHASHDLPDWLGAGHPGAIALGFEGRHEVFTQSANADYAAQVIASTGIDPGTFNSGWRNVWAGYFEWNLPVLKSLDFTLAARYDHYSDFGNTTNPKFSFRWQPMKQFLLRGSYSTGFRAPSLYELNAAQTYTNSSGGQNDPGHSTLTPDPNHPGQFICHGTYPQACNNQFEELSGGNTNLKPEKSHNATLGVVLEPVNDFTAEFDYYNIRYTNQVGVISDLDLFDPAQFANFQQYYHYNSKGQLSTDGTQCPGINCGYVSSQNQNLGGVKTDGVDIALSYRANAGSLGKLNFGLQSTWVHSFKFQSLPGGPYVQQVGIFGAYEGGSVFRWQHNGEVNWNFDPFSLGWAVHYKSGYFEAANSFANAIQGANPDYRVSAYTTMDLFGTYAMSKGFSMTLGVRNLADTKAPFDYQTNLFQTGYNPQYADVIGRTWYARGTYSF